MSDFDPDPQGLADGRTTSPASRACCARPAGAPSPSEDMKQAVRAAVHAEWRATVGEKRNRSGACGWRSPRRCRRGAGAVGEPRLSHGARASCGRRESGAWVVRGCEGDRR